MVCKSVSARFLSVIQCAVCISEEGIDIFSVVRIHADAYADRDKKLASGDDALLPERVQDLQGNSGDVLPLLKSAEKDGELVPPIRAMASESLIAAFRRPATVRSN